MFPTLKKVFHMTEQNIMYVYLYVEINKSTDVSNYIFLRKNPRV